MTYQTENIDGLLRRIEEASRVKWNSGCLPTEYVPCDGAILAISEDPIETGCKIIKEKHLSNGPERKEWITCTADEFVEHCKKMRPRD